MSTDVTEVYLPVARKRAQVDDLQPQNLLLVYIEFEKENMYGCLARKNG